MNTKKKNDAVVDNSSIDKAQLPLVGRRFEKIRLKVDEILALLIALKTMVDSIYAEVSSRGGHSLSERKFGDSPKDQLIQRIASTLPEIVTRKALSEAVGQYFSTGTLANLQSQEALSTLVPVRFKDSKKVAYTKESVITWFYEVVVFIDEDEQISGDSMICKKAS